MKRALGGGLELDDDPRRIDAAAVHDYLARESYWARGRSRQAVERLVREASRVVGLYDGARQVGFARAVSDGVGFGYLADVYVLEGYRGRGLGVELVREVVENGPLASVGWLLHTETPTGCTPRSVSPRPPSASSSAPAGARTRFSTKEGSAHQAQLVGSRGRGRA